MRNDAKPVGGGRRRSAGREGVRKEFSIPWTMLLIVVISMHSDRRVKATFPCDSNDLIC